MSAGQVVSQVINWLRTAVLVMILLLLAITLIKAFGFIQLPPMVRGLGLTELAYAGGCYWLTKG